VLTEQPSIPWTSPLTSPTDGTSGAGPLAAVYDELHRLAVQDGPSGLAAQLGETARGLRALTTR